MNLSMKLLLHICRKTPKTNHSRCPSHDALPYRSVLSLGSLLLALNFHGADSATTLRWWTRTHARLSSSAPPATLPS